MKWSKSKYRAALLIAQDRLSNREIAQRCQVSPRSLAYWKGCPEFEAEVQRQLNAWRDKARGIADRDQRIFRQNDRWCRLLTVIDERANAPEMQHAPGGKTGLLVRTQKTIGAGDHSTVVEEYTVDTALLRELRELETLTAQEMGHWERAARPPQDPVVLVVSQGKTTVPAPEAAPPLSAALPQAPSPGLPGVVIDLVPERNSKWQP